MKKMRKVNVRSQNISLLLTPCQSTAMVVANGKVFQVYDDFRDIGLDAGIPPKRIQNDIARLICRLKSLRSQTPGDDVTLQMTLDEYESLLYLFVSACIICNPDNRSTSQVERGIEKEIYDQLIQLLPREIRETLRDTQRRAAGMTARCGHLKLLHRSV